MAVVTLQRAVNLIARLTIAAPQLITVDMRVLTELREKCFKHVSFQNCMTGNISDYAIVSRDVCLCDMM